MGKTRDLFKKIRDTKGTFHAKMGSIKDRNGMDLTEAEDIKKWRPENNGKIYLKYYKGKVYNQDYSTQQDSHSKLMEKSKAFQTSKS